MGLVREFFDRVGYQMIKDNAFERGLAGQSRPYYPNPEHQEFADKHYNDGVAQQALRVSAAAKVISAGMISDGMRQGSGRYIVDDVDD